MLKSHKQNLVPESEFHIREERVKAQKTEGETATSAKPVPTPPPPPPPPPAVEKTKKEKEVTREKERSAASQQSEEKPPQKIAKVKGALTAAEARAAAEKEKKEQAAKEKGEGSKSSESASEGVGVTTEPASSTANPEPPAVPTARREAKTAGNGVTTSSSASKTTKTKVKEAVVSSSVENSGSNGHHHQARKSEGKAAAEEESGSGDSSSEKKSSSKGSGKPEDKLPKGKPKSLVDKADGAATPTSRGGSPANVPSPSTRGARGARNSPVVNQNGPTTTATPSPRAGQRRQLSETEVTETIPEKGEPLVILFLHRVLTYCQTLNVEFNFFCCRNEETESRRKSNGYPHKRLCCRYNHVFCCLFAECRFCKDFVIYCSCTYILLLLCVVEYFTILNPSLGYV